MGAFTHGVLTTIVRARREGWRMDEICKLLCGVHTRDEIVEAIDALIRNETVSGAMRHVNHVLALQSVGQPLVNGNPQEVVCRNWTRLIYRPDF